MQVGRAVRRDHPDMRGLRAGAAGALRRLALATLVVAIAVGASAAAPALAAARVYVVIGPPGRAGPPRGGSGGLCGLVLSVGGTVRGRRQLGDALTSTNPTGGMSAWTPSLIDTVTASAGRLPFAGPTDGVFMPGGRAVRRHRRQWERVDDGGPDRRPGRLGDHAGGSRQAAGGAGVPGDVAVRGFRRRRKRRDVDRSGGRRLRVEERSRAEYRHPVGLVRVCLIVRRGWRQLD